jgi:hypothetical protein
LLPRCKTLERFFRIALHGSPGGMRDPGHFTVHSRAFRLMSYQAGSFGGSQKRAIVAAK